MDKIIIQVQFSIEEDGLVFQDALNFSQDEYDALKPADIEDMKQTRFNNWKAFVAQQSNLHPTKAEQVATLEANITALEEQKAEYEAQLAEVNK